MRGALHITLALRLVACTFEVDYRGKRITCTGAADCPQGTCSRALGRCVPLGLETEPPVLTIVSPLTPTLGRVGTRFTLTLSSSEPLDRVPTVRAGFDRGGQIEFETTDPLDAQQWVFEWEVQTPSGLARLQISAVDTAGNEVTLPDQPTLSIDVDPPAAQHRGGRALSAAGFAPAAGRRACSRRARGHRVQLRRADRRSPRAPRLSRRALLPAGLGAHWSVRLQLHARCRHEPREPRLDDGSRC